MQFLPHSRGAYALACLVWVQSKDERFRDRILLLITYISFTGIGMHMVSMITSPAIFLFIMLVDKKKREDWRLWVGGILISSIMYNLSWFIVACSVVFLFTLAMMTVKGRHQEKWRSFSGFLFSRCWAFRTTSIFPVRSALNPLIDENHPSLGTPSRRCLTENNMAPKAWSSAPSGAAARLPISSVSKAIWDMGVPHHAIFPFQRARHAKNFMDNTGLAGVGMLLVYLVPTFFMLFGWYYFYRKHRNVAILLILVTLLTTIIFAWYMNFADG